MAVRDPRSDVLGEFAGRAFATATSLAVLSSSFHSRRHARAAVDAAEAAVRGLAKEALEAAEELGLEPQLPQTLQSAKEALGAVSAMRASWADHAVLFDDALNRRIGERQVEVARELAFAAVGSRGPADDTHPDEAARMWAELALEILKW